MSLHPPSALPRTPDQILEPFYPISQTADRSGDLTRHADGTAEGTVLYVGGRIMTSSSRPVADSSEPGALWVTWNIVLGAG